MNIIDKNIDSGTPFDWGRTSLDYAKFRDIYPPEFYEKIISRNLCINGQRVLDLGTGTGVLPRNMYSYGARWTATDISHNQIEQAKLLSKDMDIPYFAVPAEELDFNDSNRRLYQAAMDIRNMDDKIVDITFRYTYETPESFTKAFTRFHGATPSQIRLKQFPIKCFLPLTIHITIQGGYQMESHKIVGV